MVCGHGTRDSKGVAEFAQLVEKLRGQFAASENWPTEHGYLEFARPVLRDGLNALREQGATRILAVPAMLLNAGHAKNDIPSVLNLWAQENPDVQVEYGRALGLTASMLRAASKRIADTLASEAASGNDLPPAQTLLVTVGRGASDPDANADIAKMNRLLQEAFGFGWALPAYSGVTFPLVAPALQHAVRLGFSKVLVFPYFLFTGRLIERIYEHTDRVASAHPDIRFVKVPYLNDQDAVVETFVERVYELLNGSPDMNCQLCKYRTALPAFEDEKGLPQVSHHHHVEGVGTDTDGTQKHTHEQAQAHNHSHEHKHKHEHEHGHEHTHEQAHQQAQGHEHKQGHGHDNTHAHDSTHSHSHSHSHGDHHPYPHADHPLGPKTLH